MDSARRPQLPALSYLEVDKVKREEESYHPRNTGTPQSLSASAGASPTYHYPPGPPPPYSHAHGAPPTTNTWHPTVHTPAESRRTSEHEKESIKPRQSLPSISEALGKVDNQTSFASTPAPPSSLPSVQQVQPQTTVPPSPPARQSYAMEPPQAVPHSSYSGSSGYGHHSHHRHEASRQSSYPPPDSARSTSAAYPPVADAKPMHLQISQETTRPSVQPASYSRSEARSPHHEQQHPSHSTTSMGPPSTFPYGYAPFPPRYASHTSSTSSPSGPIYQPSTTYGPPRTSQPGWKSEPSRYEDRGLAHHSDTVKRHLDFFDLEASLNEISSTSGILSDFSRRYGDRMHQTQRSGASLNTLPGLVEVDDMINKSRVAYESLIKIRDVVLQQQAVYEQQAVDQRQQHKLYEQHPQSGSDLPQQEADDAKGGGFAGIDTKKRRGRAAPPGRCHSCNRAETPEWRRGPDGARTLCNACGLHYAKLTRKNNGATKSTNVASSNLRPKENVS
ncbi:Putative Zinc finger, GATA-type, Zinc finger, NHR/GATA-type [Septoria linicola]|uniref:Zinc finger, GATA-type, Zinc finger, NHR/GATA-type n=1 Tax=Septoria linicola TaxID=215465 RepID=A0A9Q9AE48_9PEZI|nr:Putative Zinc finger, GATA-type, Zinc finger, NHR/GATA-type [Septoria linicola]